ncbi:MAG: HesB/IscA family protein [Planctomycetaceae bacterium]
MLTMTESAAREVQKYKDSVQASPETFLRVKITAGGCSGHSYSLTLDEKYDDKADSKYDFHGQSIVVDKKSELYLDEATLNFIETLDQRGFHLDIPMAKKTCGCGSSFQI